MKIAIPVDETNAATPVCVSFGRAPYFLFYNTDNEKTTYLANPATDAQGGAGTKAAQFVLDQQADVLLTVRCGQNAADVLKAAEINIYKTTQPTAMENLALFTEGKLAPMTQFHAGFHGQA